MYHYIDTWVSNGQWHMKLKLLFKTVLDLAEYSDKSIGALHHTYHPGYHDVNLWPHPLPYSVPCDWPVSGPRHSVPEQALLLCDRVDHFLDRQETAAWIHGGVNWSVRISVPPGPPHGFAGLGFICTTSPPVYTASFCHGVSPTQQVLAWECWSLCQC